MGKKQKCLSPNLDDLISINPQDPRGLPQIILWLPPGYYGICTCVSPCAPTLIYRYYTYQHIIIIINKNKTGKKKILLSPGGKMAIQ